MKPRPFKNESGNRYGKLLVLEPSGRNKHRKITFLCQCDCGNKRVVSGNALRSGNTKSCGCMPHRLKEETGKRYGELQVLKMVTASPVAKFLCRCDCGRETIVRGTSLRKKTMPTRSCGCINAQRMGVYNRANGKWLPSGEASFRELKRRMQKTAHKRRLEWGLSEKDTKTIMKQNCVYCNIPPSQSVLTPTLKRHREKRNGDFIYNGIDRIDNTMGYTNNNVAPCCYICNRMKSSMTVKDFLSHIDTIHLSRTKFPQGSLK